MFRLGLLHTNDRKDVFLKAQSDQTGNQFSKFSSKSLVDIWVFVAYAPSNSVQI